jgi:predicted P-loop ATPase
MNERVKQLWAKAAESNFGDSWEEQTKFMERFAELIVAECINEIAYIGKANEVFGDRTDRGGLNHILWTTETAIEKIKQHFGVEK